MQGLIVLGNPWVLSRDPCWLAFLKFCWRNELWAEDGEARDPRMPDGDEGDVGKWTPASSPVNDDGKGERLEEPRDEIVGLEAALIYKERVRREEPGIGPGARRFMGTSQDDEMWLDGIEGMKTLDLSEGKGEDLGLLGVLDDDDEREEWHGE